MQNPLHAFLFAITLHANRKKPLWMTRNVLTSIKRKGKVWKKRRRSKDDTAYIEYTNKLTTQSDRKIAKKKLSKKIAMNKRSACVR